MSNLARISRIAVVCGTLGLFAATSAPAQTAPCCTNPYIDGSCTDTDPDICTDNGGVSFPILSGFTCAAVGPLCDSLIGQGACCTNLACRLETEASCTAISGTFKGVAGSCQPEGGQPACPGTLLGACCGPDRCVDTIDDFDCRFSVGGTFLGPDTVCGVDACPVPSSTTTSTTSTTSSTTTSTSTSTSTSTTTSTTTTTTLFGCPSAPRGGCIDAKRARIRFDERRPGRESAALILRKFSQATSAADFGDPVAGSTELAICLYNDSDALVGTLLISRAGQPCANKPCWRSKGRGSAFRYEDPSRSTDGVEWARFASAFGGSLRVRGANVEHRGQAALPTGVAATLAGQSSPTLQAATSAGLCIQATADQVLRDEGNRYEALRR